MHSGSRRSRAVVLNHADLTDFVLRHALLAAKAVIQEADHVRLRQPAAS
jgi:uncharacterized protein (DUF1778 family)